MNADRMSAYRQAGLPLEAALRQEWDAGRACLDDALAGCRTLVVDDDRAVRESVVQVLEAEGCRVASCGNGREALERLDRESFDLVVSDVVMPEVDGVAAIAAIKQAQPGVRIVALTTFAEADLVLGAVQVNFSAGFARNQGYIYMPGTGISVQYDASDYAGGSVMLPWVPAGTYPMLCYAKNAALEDLVVLARNFRVLSGATPALSPGSSGN